jgi:hypothetical protein
LKQTEADAATIAPSVCSGCSWSTGHEDAQPDKHLAGRAAALDLVASAGRSNWSSRATRRIARPIYARLMEAAMLQTLLWRTGRLAPPKLSLGAWSGRPRTLLLPPISLLIGLLALLCVGLFTVGEYADHRAELRLAETGRFLDQFRSGPVAEAWQRLRTAWRAEQDRQDALLARIPSLTGRDLARALHDHQMFVLETIQEYQLHDEIEVVHRFLIRLAGCVRMGSCDADVAAAQLGPALWTFRDQHRHYFSFEYSGVDLDDYLESIAPRPTGPENRGSPRW